MAMENKFLINGGFPLSGSVDVSGYKNSAGAILSAVLLSEKPSVISNLPLISDVFNQIKIIEEMGAKVEWIEEKKIKINPVNLNPEKLSAELFEKMRMSILLAAPLLMRFKKVRVPHPGGDKIGLRPISTLLDALNDLGIKTEEKNGFYCFEAPDKFKETTIVLKEFSVIATEFLMMVAALSSQKITIELSATEPQVQDLAALLKKMGAKIEGSGTHTLVIEGVKKLDGTEFTVCPDLLEVGTFLIAFAITGGSGIIKNVNAEDLTMFLTKMREIGVKFEISKEKKELAVFPSFNFNPVKIQTLPFPGFPTDLQPQTCVLLTQANGKSLVHDPLYENRFQHLHELKKMGADIEITDPHRALIFGKTELIGNKINALDIRAGAALILAGLAAKGETLIDDISHIERGYEKLEEKLRNLGAKIEKI